MQSLSEIRALLAARGLRPNRRFGQHFLHDGNHLRRIIDAAALSAGELVLEIGPGTGILTEALLEAGCEVVACEIDHGLAAIVQERLGDRITLIVGDCLERKAVSPALVDALAGRPFKLVANLPFQVAGTLVGTLILDHPECNGMYVTMQKEVAQRIMGPPGTRDYGPLSIIVQLMADIRLIGTLGRSCFWPAPEVDSAMCAIEPRRERGPERADELARFVTRIFSMRRKQLKRILGGGFTAWPEGIAGTQRPEQLTPEQFVALWRAATP